MCASRRRRFRLGWSWKAPRDTAFAMRRCGRASRQRSDGRLSRDDTTDFDCERRVPALAPRGVLAWVIALGMLATAAAISPLGEHAAQISSQIHLTVHVVIFAASIVVGAGLRDLARAQPWSRPVRLLVGALGLTGIVTAMLPRLDIAPETRHVILVIAGGVLGVALRDGLLARAARRTSGAHAYAPEAYVPSSLASWIETGGRQEAKDRVLLPRLARSFVPGRVLELGAGAGQTSLILRGPRLGGRRHRLRAVLRRPPPVRRPVRAPSRCNRHLRVGSGNVPQHLLPEHHAAHHVGCPGDRPHVPFDLRGAGARRPAR